MKKITCELNQQFAKDAEAALSVAEANEKLSLMQWSRLLAMRSARLVSLQEAHAPHETIEKELDLIEEALEGVQSESLAKIVSG